MWYLLARRPQSRQRVTKRETIGKIALTRSEPTVIHYLVHVMAAADDFCLEDGIRSVLRQAVPGRESVEVGITIPDTLRDGSPNTADNIADVQAIAERNGWESRLLTTAGLYPSENRPVTHAEERNLAVSAMRSRCDYIIVLDSDELWMPGTLEKITRLAEANIGALSVHYLPVVGSPGYPIEGAFDELPACLRSDVEFRYARSWRMPGEYPEGFRWARAGAGAFHFTMVRKTLEKLRDKILTSSHYGEKYYHYDQWLHETFPRIKPGMIDVSFYTDPKFPNFWPLVRHFTAAEWEMIPDCLKTFLGQPINEATTDPPLSGHNP